MLNETQLDMINRWQGKALRFGIVFTAITLIGAVITCFFSDLGIDKLFQPFLVAWIFWLGLGIANMALLFVHHLCGGAWSYTIQRIAEAGSRTIPFFFLTGLFIVVGGVWFSHIYPWTDPEYVGARPIVGNKALFLNKNTFTIMYLVFFGIWYFAMSTYNRWSKRLDETADVNIIAKMKFWAGPCAIMYVVTVTLAATHWLMSLEADWFSTIYGAWLIASFNLSILSFSVIILSYLMEQPPLSEKVTVKTFHHLGTFMAGFIIFWTYVSFSQFLLIWNANMPEEIGFYLHREGTSLNIITAMLASFHWLIPMLFLLFRKNKTTIKRVRKIAIWVFCARAVDMYWNIVPSFPDAHDSINFVTLALVITGIIGFGGIWFYLYLRELKKRPLLPLNDPRGELMFLKEAHGHA